MLIPFDINLIPKRYPRFWESLVSMVSSRTCLEPNKEVPIIITESIQELWSLYCPGKLVLSDSKNSIVYIHFENEEDATVWILQN